MSQYCRVIRHL